VVSPVRAAADEPVAMSRRDNAHLRCPRCRMLGGLCLCDRLPSPPLATRTRLVLLIHRLEDRKPTNTGRLAVECLANSEVVVRGHEGQPTGPLADEPDRQPLLLFPGDDAVPLAPSTRPVTLIVPDGSWRQAGRMRRRVPGLADVPCVTLPPGPPTAYRLRHEPVDGGLATMEAIARAFGILEGPEVQATLERVFLVMVERTLWSRGALASDEVTTTLPDGLDAHARR
jgi:DTW domain-containing protein YfiP